MFLKTHLLASSGSCSAAEAILAPQRIFAGECTTHARSERWPLKRQTGPLLGLSFLRERLRPRHFDFISGPQHFLNFLPDPHGHCSFRPMRPFVAIAF